MPKFTLTRNTFIGFTECGKLLIETFRDHGICKVIEP